MPDAAQFYWNAIPGPGAKHLRYMPNCSHGFEQEGKFDAALTSAIAWAKNVKNNAANPSYNWTVGPSGITVTCGSTPSSVVMWQATNPNARDFRVFSGDGVIGFGEGFTSSPLVNQGNNTFVGYCPPPAQGWTAYFVEVNFGSDHIYTSEIVVTPNYLPFAGTACL
jgi:PhoPQ-activated pathogenicity-related protein